MQFFLKKQDKIDCNHLTHRYEAKVLGVTAKVPQPRTKRRTRSCIPPSIPRCSLSSVPRRYAWRTTEWSDCRVDLLLGQQDRRRGNLTGLCGGGLQTREVYCVQANAELLKYLDSLREKDKGKEKKILWILCSELASFPTHSPFYVDLISNLQVLLCVQSEHTPRSSIILHLMSAPEAHENLAVSL